MDEIKEPIRTKHYRFDPPLKFDKGRKVGEYRFGSTMVLVSSRDFECRHQKMWRKF